MERVQVKYATRRGAVVPVRTRSASLTNGKVKRVKRYTAATIDWIAAFEPISERCFYVPAIELGDGRDEISLRLSPTKNRQVKGVRYAEDYLDPVPQPQLVLQKELVMEPAGKLSNPRLQLELRALLGGR